MRWNAALQVAPVISIIDDDRSARVAACNLIRSLGFAAQTFASAEEFLQSNQLCDSSCIISDVQMPKMNGLQLQAELAASGCRTPMILVTAFPSDSVERRALAAGAVCFLSKPLDAASVMRCIDQALTRENPDSGSGVHGV